MSDKATITAIDENVEVQERVFTLRHLKATDIKPLSTIISKIGVKHFAGALKSDAVMDTFSAIADKGEGANQKDLTYAGITAAMEVVSVIIDNYAECEHELFGFMASVAGMKANEVADLPLDDFIGLLAQIVKMDDFANFFKRAGRLFN